MAKQSNILSEIAATVIDLMKDHGTAWTKPWTTITTNQGQPISAKKREYSGINRFHLGMVMAVKGYQSPVFGTFQQWKSLGANVRKGEKSTEVVFFKTLLKKDKNDKGEETTSAIPLMKTYRVFNADQVENWDGSWIEVKEDDRDQAWNDVSNADWLIENCGAKIEWKNQDQAFYMPSTDKICMPEKRQFKDQSGYYGTMFHELIHWTGNETRLNRKFGTRFGSDGYAKEELIAELGAAMLSGITKVDAEPRADHAEYLNGWIKGLKANPKIIMTAASQAEKGVQAILDAAKTTIEAVAA